ncbi:MAG TPA: penicillin-binding protein 1C [Flavitalea sp.]|nr:penicillin-binding protein 1C [Flavitalea sp.]
MFGNQKNILSILFLLFALAGVLLGADRLFPVQSEVEFSRVILDNKGNIVHAFLTSGDKWRMKTELKEISPTLKKAILHKEDRYFYSHPGVNHFAILRALARNIFYNKRTSGASTITMQVARAIYHGKRSYLGKWKEMCRALQLEWHFSKDEIFQMYLNLVPYGGNIEGVKSAALLYLDKNPDHLSLAEITALSIIPNRPSSLVPGKNNQLIIQERNRWLRRFLRDNLFPAEEVNDALTEPFDAYRRAAPASIPHLARRLRQSGASSIYSTIDMQIQSQVERITQDYSREAKLRNIFNAAVIVMDNESGKVISYCGSPDFEDTIHGGQVDGIRAIRQPGSTLKPFVYAMAIDKGLLTPKKIITDVPVYYDGYQPENFDRQFNGPVTMQYALEHSLNIPAVKTLEAVGKNELVEFLASAGFRQVQRDERKLGLSLVLGGCGATLEELTGLYSALARGGQWMAPSYINSEPRKPKRLFSTAASYMITEILSGINRPDFPLNWQSTSRMPKIAWKTGTSYGRRDAWSIGYNKRFTIGVWVGNFSGTGSPDIVGALLATPLLFRIFNTIDYNPDDSWYSKPADCEVRLVCPETGMVPGEHCEKVVGDYFIPIISASTSCAQDQQVAISANGSVSYCKSCQPQAGYQLKWFRMLDNGIQQWYADHKIRFEKLPPHNPDCEKVFREGAPVILSPHAGTEFLISRSSPEPLLLSCRSADNHTSIYWYINDQFYKTGNRVFYQPMAGPLKISCTDDKGRIRSVSVSVKMVDL